MAEALDAILAQDSGAVDADELCRIEAFSRPAIVCSNR